MFLSWKRPQIPTKSMKSGSRKAKKISSRGVWAPILIRGGSSFVIYDTPTKEMLVQKWISREETECLTFNRHFVGDRYTLKQSKSDDTDATDISTEHQEEELIQLSIKQRAKALPRGPGAFGGNHVLVNTERVRRGIRPLCREKKLDEVAARHAKNLSKQEHLQHSSLRRTMKHVLQDGPCRLLGENISRGQSACKIHDKMMMKYAQDRNNILDRRFSAFGIGSAKSESGDLYIVQIFKG